MAVNPAVSVIMAVYNGEDHLDECVESICNQTFPDFEFIIVNDASTDSTAAMLDDWQKKDSRIRILHNKVNQQRAISRNRAITAARAPLIAVIDADDYSLSDRLGIQTTFLQGNPDIQIIGGDIFIHGTGEHLSHPRDNDDIRAGLFFDSRLFHSTVMMRKSILQETRSWYDAALPLAQDYGLWATLMNYPQAVFANIPEVLSYYRIQEKPRPGYREKQFNYANHVRANILHQLGIEANSKNMSCHLALLFGDAKMFDLSPSECAAYGNMLLNANLKKQLTSASALQKFVSDRMESIIANDILQRKVRVP